MGLDWHCSQCTYLHKVPGTRCAMCGALRTTQQQMVDFVTGNTNAGTSKSYVKKKDDHMNNETVPDPSNEPRARQERSRINPYTTKRSLGDTTVVKLFASEQSSHAATQGKHSFTNMNSSSNHGGNPSYNTNRDSVIPRVDGGSNQHASNFNNPPSIPRHRTNPYARKKITTVTSKTADTSLEPNQNISIQPHQSNPREPVHNSNQSFSTHQQGRFSPHVNPNNKINQNKQSINGSNNFLPESPDNPFKIAARAPLPKYVQGYVPGPISICEKSCHEWIYPKSEKYPERDYQLKISHSAINQNTLVSLPTGLGKTLIAAVVMYNFYRWFPSGKVVFLAPTRPLVTQQIEACYNIMGISEQDTAEMSGKIFRATRQELWGLRRVFFCTPQTLQKDIAEGRCDAQKIVCIVFDEAHKATGNYAYTKVMEQIEKSGARFRVVGLSATPGTTNNHVKEVIQALRIAKIEARLDEDPDVKSYVHTRHVEKIIVPISEEITAIENRFEKLIRPLMLSLRKENALPSYYRSDSKLKPFAIRKAMIDYNDRTKNHCLNSRFLALETFINARVAIRESGIHIAENKLNNFANENNTPFALSIINSEQFKAVMQAIAAITNISKKDSSALILTNPKLQKLNDVLNEFFKRSRASGESTRAIVFTQWRDSVEEIVKVLSNSKPLVLPAKFVGQSVSGKDVNKTTGMNQKEQQTVLKEFKKGIYNVLVCTAIGEEGLDIGEVDLIINYDCLSSPIRMVQRTGRTGRKRDGRVVSLISEGDEEEKLERSEAKTKSLWRMLKKASQTFRMVRDVPLLPVHPSLKRRSVQTKTPYHYSQVGGHTPSKRSKSNTRRIPQNETETWKLNESINAERKRLFGEINSFPDGKNKWNKKYIRAWQSSYHNSMDKSRNLNVGAFSLVLKHLLANVPKEIKMPMNKFNNLHISNKTKFQLESNKALSLPFIDSISIGKDPSVCFDDGQNETPEAATHDTSVSQSFTPKDDVDDTITIDNKNALNEIFSSHSDFKKSETKMQSLSEKNLNMIFGDINSSIISPGEDTEIHIGSYESTTVLISDSKVDNHYQISRQSDESSDDDETLCAFFDRQKKLELPSPNTLRYVETGTDSQPLSKNISVTSNSGSSLISNEKLVVPMGDPKFHKGYISPNDTKISVENDFLNRNKINCIKEYTKPDLQNYEMQLSFDEEKATENEIMCGHTLNIFEEIKSKSPDVSQVNTEDDEDLRCFQLPTPDDSSSSDDDSEYNKTLPLISSNQQLQLQKSFSQSEALKFDNSSNNELIKEGFELNSVKNPSFTDKKIVHTGVCTKRTFQNQNLSGSPNDFSGNDERFDDTKEILSHNNNTTVVGERRSSTSKKSDFEEDADSIESIHVMLPTQDTSSEEEASVAPEIEECTPRLEKPLGCQDDLKTDLSNILSNLKPADESKHLEMENGVFNLPSKNENKVGTSFQSNNINSPDYENDSPIKFFRKSKKTRNVLFSQSPQEQAAKSRLNSYPSKNLQIVGDEKTNIYDLNDTPLKDKDISLSKSRNVSKNTSGIDSKIEQNNNENVDEVQNINHLSSNKLRPARILRETRSNRKYETRNISNFFDLEAEIRSEDDMEGDTEEKSIIKDMENQRLSLDSFINDSSQLGYTQDPLDLVDTSLSALQDGSDVDDTERAFYQSINHSKNCASPFKTPIFNRRMYRKNHAKPKNVFLEDEWSRGTPQSTSSSEKGVGNMHFIRSVIDHHRKGGNSHEIEKEYEKIRLQNLSNGSNQSNSQDCAPHRPIIFNFKDKNETNKDPNDSSKIIMKDQMRPNKNTSGGISEKLKKDVRTSSSLNIDPINSQQNLPKQGINSLHSNVRGRENLTAEQRARMEKNRQEAIRKRAARLKATCGYDKDEMVKGHHSKSSIL